MTFKSIHTEYGLIDAGWKRGRLGRLCTEKDGVQTGPFGSQLHKRDYVAVGTPIITVKHLGDNRIIHHDLPRVSDSDKSRLSKYILQKGDIVFSRVGSVDRRALVRDGEDGWLFSGRCLRVRTDPKKIDPAYLSYFFGLPSFQDFIRKIAVGATMPSLNTKLLSDVEIYYPTLNKQKAIARILGRLDDKIELNRRMNETLEAMARAIFKSWFVDFDPVRAKAEGRQPVGMDAETAALFPDKFFNSKIGRVPQGWAVKSLSEVVEINPRRLLRKGQVAPYVDMKNMPVQGHRPAAWITRMFGSGTKFINGDTLLARITPCLENGKTAFVDFLEEGQTGWGSTEYIILHPKPPVPAEYGYFLARSEDLRMHAIQSMSGTSGRQRIQTECFNQFLLAVPTESVVRRFGEITRLLMNQIKLNHEESSTLTIIRDSLMPKLLSGKLRLGT